MLKKKEKAELELIEAADVDQTELKARIEELIRRGVIRPPIAPLPDDFFEQLPIKLEANVLDVILEDRYSEED